MNICYETVKRKKIKKIYCRQLIQSQIEAIEQTIERYMHPEKIIDPFLSKIDDRISVYYLIRGGYEVICEQCCLENRMPEAFGYLYLYAASILKVYELKDNFENIENIAIQRALTLDIDIEPLVYALICVNEQEQAKELCKNRNDFLYHMLCGDFEAAKPYVTALPDQVDDSKEIYYKRSIFLKEIYQGILTHNEAAFESALLKRIKKYRRNMYDYSTILDTCSIAMIKIARKVGLDYHFDIAEIPKYFLDETHRVNKEIYKLPEVPLRSL